MGQLSVESSQREQFERDGYFFLENAVSIPQLESLRDESRRFRAQMDAEMDAQGVARIGITHKDNRYFIANRFRESAVLREFLFSDLMAEICRATLGPTAFLFNEQFVLKAAERGMAFGWHQDSGYIGFPHRPYLSCWCALDDMTIENGTVQVLSYGQAGTRDWVCHAQEKATGDMIGYRGDEAGTPALIKAGGMVVFSSTVFHRSGVNVTNQMRRVYLAQYSAEPILKPDGKTLWGNAVPFLENGKKV
jgi:ectoine hydroxylase-related dioxygenase (phytanoyl-CoA dioxygenase family)